MELSNENIDRLIVRYLSGNLESQDKRVLEMWISKNQDNYDYFLKMKNLWEVTHPAFDVRSISTTKALSRIKLKMGLREKRVIRIYRYWSRVAAVLIIPILFALIYMVADRFVEQDYSKISYQKISAPYRPLLHDVFRKIGQVYNADIVVMDKDLAKHMYRATFQGETLDEILRLMKLTVPMKYIEKTSEKAMPNGVYSKRYIEVVRL